MKPAQVKSDAYDDCWEGETLDLKRYKTRETTNKPTRFFIANNPKLDSQLEQISKE